MKGRIFSQNERDLISIPQHHTSFNNYSYFGGEVILPNMNVIKKYIYIFYQLACGTFSGDG